MPRPVPFHCFLVPPAWIQALQSGQCPHSATPRSGPVPLQADAAVPPALSRAVPVMRRCYSRPPPAWIPVPRPEWQSYSRPPRPASAPLPAAAATPQRWFRVRPASTRGRRSDHRLRSALPRPCFSLPPGMPAASGSRPAGPAPLPVSCLTPPRPADARPAVHLRLNHARPVWS